MQKSTRTVLMIIGGITMAAGVYAYIANKDQTVVIAAVLFGASLFYFGQKGKEADK